MAVVLLQSVYEAAVARCREREQMLQKTKPAEDAVCTVVLDLFSDHLQDQMVNTDAFEVEDYEALLDDERRIRASIEDELRTQLAAKEIEVQLQEARSKQLEIERDELVEQLAEQTRLLEFERSALTSQLQTVRAEQDKLHGEVKDDVGVRRSLIKELSLLLDERDSLLREVSRSASSSPTNARRLQPLDHSPRKKQPSLPGFDAYALASATTAKGATPRQTLRGCVNELSAGVEGNLVDASHDQEMPSEKLSDLSGGITDAELREVAREATQVTLSSMRAELGRQATKMQQETKQVQHDCPNHDAAPRRHRWGSTSQKPTQPEQPPQAGLRRMARPVRRSASDSSRLRGSPPPNSLQQFSKCYHVAKGQGSRYPRRKLLEKQRTPIKEARFCRAAGACPVPGAPQGSSVSLSGARPQKHVDATAKPEPKALHAGFTELPRSAERAYRRHLQGLLRRIHPAAH